ncbi:hypothetical protein KIN20_026161 [Parelaphostrongylus tenuis]|uniref:Uncharacterized protein n=1 Tax=Parelaphostrongylus tenuis TaxID=148309 RepID=A0AAD5QX07_PARTN|nr:hypothetical protein KIN20_026161 [Parelaphostrongylus tenuis]
MVLSWIYDDEFASTGLKGPSGENAHHAKVLHSIFLSMESALFGMFVLAVSCDQLGAIFSEETAVEAAQRRSKQLYKRGSHKGRFMLLKEVCGGGEETEIVKERLKILSRISGSLNNGIISR